MKLENYRSYFCTSGIRNIQKCKLKQQTSRHMESSQIQNILRKKVLLKIKEQELVLRETSQRTDI